LAGQKYLASWKPCLTTKPKPTKSYDKTSQLDCQHHPNHLDNYVFSRVRDADKRRGKVRRCIRTCPKLKPATTPEEEQHLQSLPEHQFVVVRQHGQKFYLWADKPNKRLYSGNEQAYRAYKTNQKVAGATAEGGVTFIADPRGNAIAVTTYHGWAPFSEW
jgi:hypothetical protein